MRIGFTLIELLVVVLIIAVLAAIALPQYQKAVTRARAQEALLYVREVVRQQRLYFLEHGEWASSANKAKLLGLPNLPNGIALHEWYPGSRITVRTNGKYNYDMYLYDYYSPSTEDIYCQASPSSARAVAACSSLSGGNEITPSTNWRRFIIQCQSKNCWK